MPGQQKTTARCEIKTTTGDVGLALAKDFLMIFLGGFFFGGDVCFCFFVCHSLKANISDVEVVFLIFSLCL